jgi:hypothetical protein
MQLNGWGRSSVLRNSTQIMNGPCKSTFRVFVWLVSDLLPRGLTVQCVLTSWNSRNIKIMIVGICGHCAPPVNAGVHSEPVTEYAA